jgi:ketosteroid isomerase-like protein
MREAHVEAVREWINAFNRRDAEAILELAHPDVDYRPYLAALSGGSGSYHGHRGLRRYLHDLDEAWSAFEAQIHSLRAVGEHVLMEGRLRARGRKSGVEVDAEMAWLHSFRDGKYARLRIFQDSAEAAEAAARENLVTLS